jgi:hypothetical protein
MDKAKMTSIEGLQMRKVNYKGAIIDDERDIRNLKNDLETWKTRAEEEVKDYANQIIKLKTEL